MATVKAWAERRQTKKIKTNKIIIFINQQPQSQNDFNLLLYFFLKVREEENIQNLDWSLGPSFTNSCPRLLPHLEQATYKQQGGQMLQHVHRH